MHSRVRETMEFKTGDQSELCGRRGGKIAAGKAEVNTKLFK